MILFSVMGLHAQRTECITDHNENIKKQNDAAYRNDRAAYENSVQQWIAAHAGNSVQSVITIPVVVHVIYKTAVQNISDNQVYSQMQVLNEDYGRTNPDTVNTPSGFQSVAANTGIQFCLAQVDPGGNATTGIEHIPTAVTSWTQNDNVKHTSLGGKDAWDPTRYFNIWVCNLGAGLLAYGEFPTGTVSQTFGAVVLYSAFGSNHTSYGTFADIMAPYDYGRSATHEVAHCFNLYHISPSNTCVDNDQVTDTPPIELFPTGGCPAYPLLDACNTVTPGAMFMNYMFYEDDNCMNLFTAGQAVRMNAVLNVAPYNSLVTSNACVPLGINSFSNENEISVTPNPSSGKFILNVKKNSGADIVVYDNYGNLVMKIDRAEVEKGIFEMDLSSMADGIYFIRMNGNEEAGGKKIIICR
ncbi:MAG: T9SS type A sorting domain-containing protein [Bacteroidetes bacterium]|nr:T9SS type A sorting domain-containing protein [Bacteroidota bacterium]